jgi:hypothetical protein
MTDGGSKEEMKEKKENKMEQTRFKTDWVRNFFKKRDLSTDC